jgi:two-component system, LytTR family, sensor kinase
MKVFNITLRKFIIQELRDILILIAICTFATYMFVGNQIFINFSIYYKSIFYSFIVGLSIWKGNQYLGYFLAKKFPWEKNPSKTLFYIISASVIFTAVDIAVVNYLIYKFVYHISISDNFERIFNYEVITFGIALLITTIIYLKHFFLSWKSLVVREEEFKHQALALQYETLKSYVNPHFLFNSLSVLSSLVEKDTVKSQKFIKQLSDIYRYVLEQKDKELVDLSTELAFAQSFIDLHKIRHGENLKVEVHVDDLTGYIIPLSMQILLENAFKHNIISEEEPLEVKVWRENDFIIVQNKFQERRTINQSSGFGLDTITKRYEFFTKQELIVTNSRDFFTVKIPVLGGYK